MIKKLVLNLDYRIMQKATHDFVLGRKNLSVERYEASYGIDKARLVSIESLDEIKYLITWETSMNEFRIMMSQ